MITSLKYSIINCFINLSIMNDRILNTSFVSLLKPMAHMFIQYTVQYTIPVSMHTVLAKMYRTDNAAVRDMFIILTIQQVFISVFYCKTEQLATSPLNQQKFINQRIFLQRLFIFEYNNNTTGCEGTTSFPLSYVSPGLLAFDTPDHHYTVYILYSIQYT